MILPVRPSYLNAFETVVYCPIPPLQLQSNIRTIGENQRILGILLNRLSVPIFGFDKVAVSERGVALFFKLVCQIRHEPGYQKGDLDTPKGEMNKIRHGQG
jgi:hypothetical protein